MAQKSKNSTKNRKTVSRKDTKSEIGEKRVKIGRIGATVKECFSKDNLWKFLEVRSAVEGGFGNNNGKTMESHPKDFAKHKNQYLNAMALMCEYFNMNPAELVDLARQAFKETQVMTNLKLKLEKFKKHLFTDLGYSKPVQMRGWALKLFSANVGKIPDLNHDIGFSDTKVKNTKAGIDNDFLREMMIQMGQLADFEMKTYISWRLSNGHRGSDMCCKHLDTIRNQLKRDLEVISWTVLDVKRYAMITNALGREQQYYLQNYITEITDDREFLFGNPKNYYPGKSLKEIQTSDWESVERRLTEKWNTLFRRVCKARGLDPSSIDCNPHKARHVCKNLLKNLGTSNKAIKLFTGDKVQNNDAYTSNSEIESIRYFKQIEKLVSFGNFQESNNEMEMFDKFLDLFKETIENDGRREHLIHLSHESDEDSLDQNLILKVKIKMATLVDSFLKKAREGF